MEDRRLNLSERLTLVVGIASLLTAIVSAAIAYLAYKQALDTSDLREAVRHLGELATQAHIQTDATRRDIRLLEDGLRESRAQSRILGEQARSLASQAQQERMIASANTSMARSSIDALGVQQRALFYSASTRLSMEVEHIDGGFVRGDSINVDMTLLVHLKGLDPVKNYSVIDDLVPFRDDGHYQESMKSTCELADRFGKALGSDLEKDNRVGLQAAGTFAQLTTTQYGGPPSPHPVYIGCASYTSPIDGSIHHVGVIEPVMLIDGSGNEIPIVKGDRDIPATSLRRVDFASFAD